MPTSPARSLLAAIALLLALTSAASADQTIGAVVVRADADRRDLTVDLTSDREPDRRWSAHASRGADAVIGGLFPGTYHLVVTVAGGVSGSADAVIVRPGEVVSFEIVTAGSTLQLRVADRRRLAGGLTFDARQMDAMPSGSGLAGLLDAAAPSLIVDRLDTGGLGLAMAPRIGSRGASWTDASMTVEGVATVEHPDRGGITGNVPDLNALEAVAIVEGSATPDLATSGATVVLVPRRPGANRRAAIDASFSGGALVATNRSATAPSIEQLESWKGGTFSAGGPLGSKTGGFISASAFGLSARERARDDTRSDQAATAWAHVVANAAPRSQIRLIAGAQRLRGPYESMQAAGPEARETTRFLHAAATWERQSTNGARFEAMLGIEHAAFVPSIEFGRIVAFDRVVDGRVPLPVSRAAVSRPELRLAFAPAARAGHAFEAGLTWSRSASRGQSVPSPQIAELIDGLPARTWIAESSGVDSHRHATSLAAYLADRIRLRENVTVNLGLRVEDARGAASGSASHIDWHAVLPRVSARWTTPVAAFFAGYGRYQAPLPLRYLAFGDPGEATVRGYRWVDANGDKAVGAGEAETLVSVWGRGPALADIDPDIRAPYTDELTFGAERTLSDSTTLGVTGTVRRARDLVRSVNIGAGPSSYDVRLVPDAGVDYDGAADDDLLAVFDRRPASFGEDRYLLTNVEDDRASYDGIEVSWRTTRPTWWGYAAASAFRTDARAASRGFRVGENDLGVLGEVFENPNATTNARGRLFADRAYVLKLAAGYDAPHDVRIGLTARYQDGQPFARLVVVPDLRQGPEIVAAYPNGRTRFTFTATVDAKVEKRVRVAGHAAAVRIEVFNLTNLGLEVEENPITGPAFRQTTAVQPPRAIRIGFHLEF